MDLETQHIVRQLGTQLADLQRRLASLENSSRSSQLPFSSVDAGALSVNDEFGTTFSVIGLQGDGTFSAQDVNSLGPDQPTDPAVTPDIQSLQVGWDGGFQSGALPVNWDHLEVHVSTVDGFTPSQVTLNATMVKAGTVQAAPLVPGTTYFVVFVPVDSSGGQGTPSNQVSGVPNGVADSIDPGSITSTMISDGAITTPLLAAGAVSTVNLQSDSVTADALAAGSVVAGIIDANAIDGMTINAATINGGVITGADFIATAGTGGYFAYSTGGTVVETLTGAGTWTCPPGVTSVQVECVAAGGGCGGPSTLTAFGGGGGGGGEYAAEPNYATTPGNGYAYSAGLSVGPAASGVNGTNGADTTFDTGAGNVHAHGGHGGTRASSGATGGNGGSGSGNSTHHNGGTGGTGQTVPLAHGVFFNVGGGGGSSGGQNAAGKNGVQNAPGSAVTGGGAGGAGGASNGVTNGRNGGQPGGGAGAGANNSSSGGSSGPGYIKLTYTAATATLVASVAGGTAVTDPVNGGTVPQGFGGTLTAFAPGTATIETDHAPTFSNNGTGTWANAAGRLPTTYRLVGAPANDVEWSGSLVIPAGFAAGQAIIAAVPAGYRPSILQSRVAIDVTNNVAVRLAMTSGGVLQFSGPAAGVTAGDLIDFHFLIRL